MEIQAPNSQKINSKKGTFLAPATLNLGDLQSVVPTPRIETSHRSHSVISSANHNKIHPEFAEESKHQSPRFSNFNSANQINHVEEFHSE